MLKMIKKMRKVKMKTKMRMRSSTDKSSWQSQLSSVTLRRYHIFFRIYRNDGGEA